MTLNAKDESMF